MDDCRRVMRRPREVCHNTSACDFLHRAFSFRLNVSHLARDLRLLPHTHTKFF